MQQASLTDLEAQVRLSKMLSLGFVLTLTQIGGLDSIVAMLIGLRALIVIYRSSVYFSGRVMAWWCLVCGGINTMIMLPQLILMLINPTE